MVLVIGYGNDLRSDDGAGRRVVELVEAMGLPHVETISTHQLTPELAERMAESRLTIFVDAVPARALQARLVGPTVIRLRASRRLPTTLGHAPDPGSLLFLSRGLYGGRPRALLIAVPALSMDYGETLSDETEAAAQGAARMVRRIAARRATVVGIRRRVAASV
jgi:hydrogenase maturation protease